jgi:DNA-binding CsgD family transcriptional regulator
VHRALADLVSDQEERVRHLALGCESLNEMAAAELQAAAKGARRRGAPSAAAELTQLALRLVEPKSPAARRLQLELAEHLFLASDFHGSRALLEELREVLAPGELRARALLTLAEIEYWRSGESAAVAVSEEALAASDDPLLRARCQAQIAMYAGTVDLPKAAAAAQTAVELLDVVGDADPALIAAALSAGVRARLFLGEGFDRGAADRALELESAAPPASVDNRVAFKLVQWLRYVDELEEARAQLDQVEGQARDEGDESSLGNILLNRVIVETWLGDWEQAAVSTERMGEAFAQQGVESAGIAPWLAYLDAYAGRLDSVRSIAGPRPEEPVIAAVWSRLLGLAELAAGDANAAYRHLAAALNDLDRVDFREPAIWRVDGDAIEAALAAGAVVEAERWLRRFEDHAARSRIPWSLAVSARCRGLLSAAGGELEAAAEAVERSLSDHERCPMPFERARTLLVHGQVLRRLKRKRDARSSLEEAREVFRRLGADPWAARVDEELKRVAVRRAPESLSATELRIAQLAAAGLTNPEIATQAFVSRKTVEANLARVYRKLDISSRAQLGRALDERTGAIS